MIHIGAIAFAMVMIIGVLRYAYLTIYWIYSKGKQWEDDREHQQIVNQLVMYELNPNSGHSLKDQVHRMELRIVKVENKLGVNPDETLPMPERRQHDKGERT